MIWPSTIVEGLFISLLLALACLRVLTHRSAIALRYLAITLLK
jgi:hypothetical protein